MPSLRAMARPVFGSRIMYRPPFQGEALNNPMSELRLGQPTELDSEVESSATLVCVGVSHLYFSKSVGKVIVSSCFASLLGELCVQVYW